MTSHSDDTYLKVGDLSEWLNVSRSTIYRWVEQNHFPNPVILGLGKDDGQRSVTRWKRSDVEAWLDARERGRIDGE